MDNVIDVSPDLTFEKAFLFTMRWEDPTNEGILVTDKFGGLTKFGISEKNHPNIDVKSLTLQDVKNIYRTEYWDPYPFNQLKDINIAIKLFDMTVNMGSKSAIPIVQRALRACFGLEALEDDGVIGPLTISLINQVTEGLLQAVRAEQSWYYKNLVNETPILKDELNGWLRRAYG